MGGGMHACQLTRRLRSVLARIRGFGRRWGVLQPPVGPVLYAWASWQCAACGVSLSRLSGVMAQNRFGRGPTKSGGVRRWNGNVRSSNRLPPTVSWAGFRIPSKPLAPSRHGGTQAATHYSNPDHPPPTQPCHGSPPCPGSTTLGTHRGVVLAMHSYLSSDGWNTSLPIHPSRSRIASRLDRRR